MVAFDSSRIPQHRQYPDPPNKHRHEDRRFRKAIRFLKVAGATLGAGAALLEALKALPGIIEQLRVVLGL